MYACVSLQINLYQNLLRKKHGQLTNNMERLVGGLEKLKSTAAQVNISREREKKRFLSWSTMFSYLYANQPRHQDIYFLDQVVSTIELRMYPLVHAPGLMITIEKVFGQ